MNLPFPRRAFCRRLPWRALAASLLLFGAASFGPPATPASAADAAPAPAILAIGGAVRSPLTLERSDLAAMPRTTITAKDKSGANITYEGVELAELLKRAGVPLGEELRGPALLLAVVITASDGYHAVFALSELDPAMTDKKVLLADTAEGKILPPETGPFRLVVPEDKRHARWVRLVTRIDVIRVNPTPSPPATPNP
jgi:DMSO/TMAO reductase YedYZ molybdopterin-dependent catalytic subunit